MRRGIYQSVGGHHAIETGPTHPVVNLPTLGAEVGTGIQLQDGVLYILQSAAGSSVLNKTHVPNKPELTPTDWSTSVPPGPAANGMTMTTGPQALKICKTAAGAIKMYAVSGNWDPANAVWVGTAIYYFEDTIATTGPVLTGPPDGQLVQVTPLTGTQNAVSFSWERPSKATNYMIQISLDDAFTQVVNSATVYTTPTTRPTLNYVLEAGQLTPGTTYYWRVMATVPIYSAWSEVRSIIVQPGAASVPVIGAPENGAVVDSLKPAFSWSPVAGTTMYEFELSIGTTFAAPLYSTTLGETGIRPPVELERGTTYFWRVRALDPVTGDWSTIGNFTVAEEAEPPPPPVEIIQQPAPVIEIPPAPPAQVIEIPPAPTPPAATAQGYIWAIIIIGAVLIIVVIVLVIRTRRQGP